VTPHGVPSLDSLSGDWLSRDELAHLPSLRNQWGQAHANADLTSLSWLAIPPYSGGYHTGALRVDGRVLPAQDFQWAPWGVRRRASDGAVSVVTDTRMGYESTDVLWRVEVTNTVAEPVVRTVTQELFAPIAVSEVDWGWLYGTPWNAGHYHDFFTTERIREQVTADHPGSPYLAAPGPRLVRLGRPRDPGMQRDEDSAPMLLESELPDHTSPDSGRVRPPAAIATIRGVEGFTGDYRIGDPLTEFRLEAVENAPVFEVRLDSGQTGVLLTHGNHPDSVQFGVADGVPWLRIAGELLTAPTPLEPGRWHRLAAQVTDTAASLMVDGDVVATTQPWWSGQRWHATAADGAVVITDSASTARSTYTFDTAPDVLTADSAQWTLTLAPGETVVLGTTLAIGGQPDPGTFAERFTAVADRWRYTWASAFTPGNTEFSGHLPTLVSPDDGLARSYYLGALLAIYLRNTGVSEIGPVFLTGGPRLGATTTFYWDQSEWARTAALLEPVGMRAWIIAALSQPYDQSHSFDTRNLVPIGNHYASNDHALFRTVQAYVGVTGDLDLLDEKAGESTVLDHLRAMAYRPRTQRATFGGGVLVDFGDDAWELLECVPNYRHAVISFNAGYAGMLRDLSVVLRHRGETAEAQEAARDADELVAAVLDQYAGAGRWRVAHPHGEDTIGHVLDFAIVAADIPGDLSQAQRTEMVDFVSTHLIDGDWMRALAPDDPIAPLSDRPDHGAAGAFCAWPGATAYGLCRLGRPDLAQSLLTRVHAGTSGAVWGQAMEHIGDGRYRVAERGVSNRDSNAGVAVTEAVIAGLFGLDADFADIAANRMNDGDSLTAEPGALLNINAHGFADRTSAAPRN